MPDQRRGHILFATILLVGFAADLFTKSWAFEKVPTIFHPEIEVIEGFFYIDHVENPGAMWSLFQDLPPWFWVIVRGSVFAMLFIFYWKKVEARWWVHAGFGLVLAGACGNVYDNLFADGGRVRDFLQFIIPIIDRPFPTFNLADSMICVGAGLLLVYFYRLDREAKQQAVA